jgi:serine protease Do
MLSQTMRMTAARKMPERLMTMTMALAVLALMVTLAGAARAGTAELETAMDAVLVVRSADAEDRFLGSAFLWGDGSVAVTNAHVVGAADEVRLVDRHGRKRWRWSSGAMRCGMWR